MKILGIEKDAVYKATVCNRCGEVFLRKYIRTDYLDGGFTKHDNFGENPKGWRYHDTTGTLCPDCEELYQSQLQAFMEYTEERENEN